MINALIENILQLIIVSPLVFLSLNKRDKETLKVLLVFIVYFLVRISLLHLPFEYSQTNFIKGNWNWSGKVFAIVSSLLFLLVYRKFKLKDYFLTFKQNQIFIKKGVVIIGLLLLIGSIMSFFLSTPQEWDVETILFQLTMPGVDEEIAYRGIMLGLLTKILKDEINLYKFSIKNPSIIVTTLLFGLAHGFFLTDSFDINFKMYPFIITMIKGLIWGWITIESGSVLFALISHNLGNFTDKLIRMR